MIWPHEHHAGFDWQRGPCRPPNWSRLCYHRVKHWQPGCYFRARRQTCRERYEVLKRGAVLPHQSRLPETLLRTGRNRAHWAESASFYTNYHPETLPQSLSRCPEMSASAFPRRSRSSTTSSGNSTTSRLPGRPQSPQNSFEHKSCIDLLDIPVRKKRRVLRYQKSSENLGVKS